MLNNNLLQSFNKVFLLKFHVRFHFLTFFYIKEGLFLDIKNKVKN